MRFYTEANKLQNKKGRLCLMSKVYSLDTDFCSYKSTQPFQLPLLIITKRLAISDKGLHS